jgi:predicted  nucleic acid-binding Zn-ribbon protein
MTMLPELEKLVRLQELDIEIARTSTELKQSAEQMTQIAAERKKRSTLLEKLEKDLQALTLRRRATEASLQQREQQKQKFSKQQQLVKTPKELAAVNHEIESCDADISRLEEEILGQMDEEENRSVDLQEKKQSAAKLSEKASETELRLKTGSEDRKKLLSGLKQDRIVAANQLSSELRETYEYLVKKFGPTAVTKVRSNACGGCGGILVPNLILEAASGRSLTQCNHCLRYLTNE